jgi:hypothetical protein
MKPRKSISISTGEMTESRGIKKEDRVCVCVCVCVYVCVNACVCV